MSRATNTSSCSNRSQPMSRRRSSPGGTLPGEPGVGGRDRTGSAATERHGGGLSSPATAWADSPADMSLTPSMIHHSARGETPNQPRCQAAAERYQRSRTSSPAPGERRNRATPAPSSTRSTTTPEPSCRTRHRAGNPVDHLDGTRAGTVAVESAEVTQYPSFCAAFAVRGSASRHTYESIGQRGSCFGLLGFDTKR